MNKKIGNRNLSTLLVSFAVALTACQRDVAFNPEETEVVAATSTNAPDQATEKQDGERDCRNNAFDGFTDAEILANYIEALRDSVVGAPKDGPALAAVVEEQIGSIQSDSGLQQRIIEALCNPRTQEDVSCENLVSEIQNQSLPQTLRDGLLERYDRTCK